MAKHGLTSAVMYSVNVVARDDDFGRSASDFINITTGISIHSKLYCTLFHVFSDLELGGNFVKKPDRKLNLLKEGS